MKSKMTLDKIAEIAGNHRNHGVGSPGHFQESDFSMLYYLSHSHFT